MHIEYAVGPVLVLLYYYRPRQRSKTYTLGRKPYSVTVEAGYRPTHFMHLYFRPVSCDWREHISTNTGCNCHAWQQTEIDAVTLKLLNYFSW